MERAPNRRAWPTPTATPPTDSRVCWTCWAWGPTRASSMSRIRPRDLEPRWARILERLEAAAEHLVDQGGLVAKSAQGRRVWVVRYLERCEGRRVHKSIYVAGDDQPELLRRCRER